MPQTIKLRERRVQGYLKQPNFNIFTKVVEVEDMSESKCLNMIIKEWFNNLSPGASKITWAPVIMNRKHKGHKNVGADPCVCPLCRINNISL